MLNLAKVTISNSITEEEFQLLPGGKKKYKTFLISLLQGKPVDITLLDCVASAFVRAGILEVVNEKTFQYITIQEHSDWLDNKISDYDIDRTIKKCLFSLIYKDRACEHLLTELLRTGQCFFAQDELYLAKTLELMGYVKSSGSQTMDIYPNTLHFVYVLTTQGKGILQNVCNEIDHSHYLVNNSTNIDTKGGPFQPNNSNIGGALNTNSSK